MPSLAFDELTTLAVERGWRFVVLFGSRAAGAEQPESDVDLAIMPEDLDREPVKDIESVVDRLQRSDLDIAWLPHASWLLWWEIARSGKLVWEASPGEFSRFKLTAWLRYFDSGLWRRLDRQFAERALAGRWHVDTTLVRRKLSLVFEYLKRLDQVLDDKRFDEEFTLYHTAERLTELLVECAGKINAEVSQAVAGIPPADYYSSFYSLLRTGWIDRATADALARAASLRNALVHQYDEVAPPDLHSRVREARFHWWQYARSVHEKLVELERSTQP